MDEYEILRLATKFADQCEPLYRAIDHKIIQATTEDGVPSREDLIGHAANQIRVTLRDADAAEEGYAESGCGGVHVSADVPNDGGGPIVLLSYMHYVADFDGE